VRTTRIIAACAAIALCQAAYGADAKSNAVSLDPIAVLFNLYSGSYERALGESLSAKLSVAYSPNFLWLSDLSYFDATVEGRFYFGAALRDLLGDADPGERIRGRLMTPGIVGPYAAAFVGCLGASADDWTAADAGGSYTFDADAFGLGAGAGVGLKYALSDGGLVFFAEPFVGARFYALVGGDNGWRYVDSSGDAIPKPEGFEDGFSRSGLYFGVNVGLAF